MHLMVLKGCGSVMQFLLCSGGLELLCDSVKIHNVDVEPKTGAEKVKYFYHSILKCILYGVIVYSLLITHT